MRFRFFHFHRQIVVIFKKKSSTLWNLSLISCIGVLQNTLCFKSKILFIKRFRDPQKIAKRTPDSKPMIYNFYNDLKENVKK